MTDPLTLMGRKDIPSSACVVVADRPTAHSRRDLGKEMEMAWTHPDKVGN